MQPEPNVVSADFGRKVGRRFSHAALSKLLTDPALNLTSSERCAALVIFQHVKVSTLRCNPTVGTICRRAKCGRHTVASTIRKLQENKLCAVTKKRDRGKFYRYEYNFTPMLQKL